MSEENLGQQPGVYTLASRPSQGPSSRGLSSRIAYLDNARFWGMVLVVVGHCLLYFVSLQPGRAIYYWIYLFHMPLFVLLCGYLSRDFRATPQQLKRAVSTLVVPYFLVESAYQVLRRHYTGEPDPYMLLSPKWVAWFLAALVVWRMSTPIWRSLRHPILVSILISLLVPLTEVPNVLAMHKVLGMLPFYVIGMHMSLERFRRLADLRVRAASVVFLSAVGLVCWMFSESWVLSWTKWRDRYDELSVGPVEGLLTRAGLIAVGVLMCFAVLSLVPWTRTWTSALGGRTLYCYLLHGFVVFLIAQETQIFTAMRDAGGAGLALTAVAAIAVAVLLMTRPIARAFGYLFEPNVDWAFRRAQAPST